MTWPYSIVSMCVYAFVFFFFSFAFYFISALYAVMVRTTYYILRYDKKGVPVRAYTACTCLHKITICLLSISHEHLFIYALIRNIRRRRKQKKKKKEGIIQCNWCCMLYTQITYVRPVEWSIFLFIDASQLWKLSLSYTLYIYKFISVEW